MRFLRSPSQFAQANVPSSFTKSWALLAFALFLSFGVQVSNAQHNHIWPLNSRLSINFNNTLPEYEALNQSLLLLKNRYFFSGSLNNNLPFYVTSPNTFPRTTLKLSKSGLLVDKLDESPNHTIYAFESTGKKETTFCYYLDAVSGKNYQSLKLVNIDIQSGKFDKNVLFIDSFLYQSFCAIPLGKLNDKTRVLLFKADGEAKIITIQNKIIISQKSFTFSEALRGGFSTVSYSIVKYKDNIYRVSCAFLTSVRGIPESSQQKILVFNVNLINETLKLEYEHTSVESFFSTRQFYYGSFSDKMEFSKTGNKLYFSKVLYDTLYCVDFTGQLPILQKLKTKDEQGYLELGPDGKLYGLYSVNLKSKNINPYVNIIHRPDSSFDKICYQPAFMPQYSSLSDDTLHLSDLVQYSIPLIPSGISPLGFPALHQVSLAGGIIPNFTLLSDFSRYVWYYANGDSFVGRNGSGKHMASLGAGKHLLKLKCYSPDGFYNWYWDSIRTYVPPVAAFGVQAKAGCQYVGYQFTNTTSMPPADDVKLHYRWNFGDGSPEDTAKNPSHVYTSSGTFTVRLIALTHDWADTFILQNKVDILPAAKAKLVLNDTVGCGTLNLTYGHDVKEQYSQIWHMLSYSNGKVDSLGQSGTIPLVQGRYQLVQYVLSPTGCITSQSESIRVYDKISDVSILKPLIDVLDGDTSIIITWQKRTGTIGYKVYSDFNGSISLLANKGANDTSLTLASSENDLLQSAYQVRVIDSCGNEAVSSPWVSPLYLQGKLDNEGGSALQWPVLPAGYPQNYCLRWRTSVDSPWNTLPCVSTSSTQDPDFLDRGGDEATSVCYQVVALTSPPVHSNTLCLVKAPWVYVPNAFSPNTDGTNEVWKPSLRGIKRAEAQVLNRWGAIVWEANSTKEVLAGWDGKDAPEGIYRYSLRVLGTSGGWKAYSGSLQLLR